ncbi:MAG: sensor histidine kinase [Elusimicrobiota bacterium]
MSPPQTQPQLSGVDSGVVKKQLLATSILTFFVFLMYSWAKSPFHPFFPYIVLTSCVFHLLLYFLVGWISFKKPSFLAFVSVFNIFLLGVAIHLSGGVISPFIMSFFCIILSDVANGIEYPIGMVTSVLVYGFVIMLEYFNWVKPVNISTSEIYSSGVLTFSIILGTAFLLIYTGQIYKVIMANLRLKLEQEHNEKNKMVHELARLEAPSNIGLMVNKITHDIRGPLQAISSFVSMMQDNNTLNKEDREDCALILKEICRVSNLVNRMLKYVKPGELEKIEFSAVDLIETMLAVISFYPGAKKIRFKNKLPLSAENEYLLFANKEELQQVFFNIYKNSIEALSTKTENPHIWTGIVRDNNDVIITISDNGPGMPNEIKDKLFLENFSSKKEGNGLGLMISKQILLSYQGDLVIQNKEQGGLRVVVRLPSHSSAKVTNESESNLIHGMKL